jgi:glycosyltransferase involved in cell wall biosynthesis
MADKAVMKKNILWIHKMLNEEESIQLFSGAKVFVCPSVYEPFGIINLEAMACKVPVVASKVGGILEVVVPEETGILVKPGKPLEIAEAVNRLLQDKSTAVRFGENGRRRAEELFSWQYIARQTKELYDSLMPSPAI